MAYVKSIDFTFVDPDFIETCFEVRRMSKI